MHNLVAMAWPLFLRRLIPHGVLHQSKSTHKTQITVFSCTKLHAKRRILHMFLADTRAPNRLSNPAKIKKFSIDMYL